MDQHITYPGDNFVLAKYLGPSFDICSVMTCKLLKKNGEYAHMSTIRALADAEMVDPLEIKDRKVFDSNI